MKIVDIRPYCQVPQGTRLDASQTTPRQACHNRVTRDSHVSLLLRRSGLGLSGLLGSSRRGGLATGLSLGVGSLRLRLLLSSIALAIRAGTRGLGSASRTFVTGASGFGVGLGGLGSAFAGALLYLFLTAGLGIGLGRGRANTFGGTAATITRLTTLGLRGGLGGGLGLSFDRRGGTRVSSSRGRFSRSGFRARRGETGFTRTRGLAWRGLIGAVLGLGGRGKGRSAVLLARTGIRTILTGTLSSRVRGDNLLGSRGLFFFSVSGGGGGGGGGGFFGGGLSRGGGGSSSGGGLGGFRLLLSLFSGLFSLDFLQVLSRASTGVLDTLGQALGLGVGLVSLGLQSLLLMLELGIVLLMGGELLLGSLKLGSGFLLGSGSGSNLGFLFLDNLLQLGGGGFAGKVGSSDSTGRLIGLGAMGIGLHTNLGPFQMGVGVGNIGVRGLNLTVKLVNSSLTGLVLVSELVKSSLGSIEFLLRESLGSDGLLVRVLGSSEDALGSADLGGLGGSELLELLKFLVGSGEGFFGLGDAFMGSSGRLLAVGDMLLSSLEGLGQDSVLVLSGGLVGLGGSKGISSVSNALLGLGVRGVALSGLSGSGAGFLVVTRGGFLGARLGRSLGSGFRGLFFRGLFLGGGLFRGGLFRGGFFRGGFSARFGGTGVIGLGLGRDLGTRAGLLRDIRGSFSLFFRVGVLTSSGRASSGGSTTAFSALLRFLALGLGITSSRRGLTAVTILRRTSSLRIGLFLILGGLGLTLGGRVWYR
eukprot:TRINITY_DN2934_c0_g1_i3.p1 TRINITY_DN2934_c0_g1~~TRINITY_DN2934_c0_g1_i3.p1  ORF type:complete len:757 (+),score=66.29 TRINITY_DN2934_c0_g1_i3:40-2310(+)